MRDDFDGRCIVPFHLLLIATRCGDDCDHGCAVVISLFPFEVAIQQTGICLVLCRYFASDCFVAAMLAAINAIQEPEARHLQGGNRAPR
jgi:hypothetical protein